ncbi:hypothetical protein Q0590_36340 [Rhodocytophaga aerolata]|uniref:Uncharacterized protein n=1 Tax=Rhodocytophaga aerolata TaxID=455078 RepID=A0ABT8RI64_9BACT|nr:hypothetical protein [Rhodocytophaga aerolata]MDO1451801.1 hypothetical protein [Rhodocytophaga aerolata]
MKGLLSLFIGLMLSTFSFSQKHQRSMVDFSSYFTLKAERSAGNEKILVYPAVVDNPKGETGKFIKMYSRRFNYLLQNRTNFARVYNHLYPDTLTMTRRYTDSLQHNQVFKQYFNAFTYYINSPSTKNSTKIAFSVEEMMQVASKFFYCDLVKPDTTVSWHVCVGFNGLQDVVFDKDYTLLEAFCFEAIFTNMLSEDPEKSKFMDNFINYVTTSTNKQKQKFTSNQDLLQKVKHEVFLSMEFDKQLQVTLLDYYYKNQNNLPFQIEQ